MYRDDDLDAAAKAGILTPEAVTAFKAFAAQRRPDPDPNPDEESVRLITGFNDLFVTIAAGLLLWAIGALVENVSTLAGEVAMAAAAWAFAEHFTRKRRMALPSVVLLLVFVWTVFAAGLAVLKIDDFRLGGYGVAGAALAAGAAAWAHWRRFRVPITVAAGAAAGAGAVLAALLGLIPATRDFIPALFFMAGLGLFALAMRWDSSDLERKTRRSDTAFWLHLAAAPLIVHPAFTALGVSADKPQAALGAVAVYVVLAYLALLVDRRALLVSALAYVLYAAWTLFKSVEGLGESYALAGLVIGSALLSLSAFWAPIRRAALKPLPEAWRRRLPSTNP